MSNNLTPNQQIISDDILRYKKNSLPANLALLGLVFNCLYFMLLYAIKVSTISVEVDGVPVTSATRFADLTMGFSVVITLFMLLISFLASEGIKGYNKKYCITLLVLAAFQIIRIFGYPLYGLQNDMLKVNYFFLNPTESVTEFIILLVYLCASAACFVASAVTGYFRCKRLETFEANIASGAINVDATLKELDEEDERQATNVLSEAKVTDKELELVKEDANA